MHHRITATVTALVLCACLLLTGCSAHARQRDLIRNDPMYSATWDGIEFLGTEDSKDDGPKPPPVATTRCFTMTIPPEDALQKVMATAEQSGWTEDRSSKSSPTRTAGKGSREGGMSLYVSTEIIRCKQYPETNFVVSIAL